MMSFPVEGFTGKSLLDPLVSNGVIIDNGILGIMWSLFVDSIALDVAVDLLYDCEGRGRITSSNNLNAVRVGLRVVQCVDLNYIN